MKILSAIVVPPHLSVSGGTRAAEHLSAALATHCDVTVASMMHGGAGEAGGVGRVPVRSKLPPFVPWSKLPNRYSSVLYRSDLPRIIRDGDYDLVHLHNPMPGLEFERVAKACSSRGIPYIISTHGFNEVANGLDVYGFGPLRRLIWRELVSKPVARAVRNASGIFALSPADFDIVREMGFDGVELSVVGNGVYLPTSVDLAADRAALERLGVPTARSAEQITCMFLANHTPNKGLPVLLDAFAGMDVPYLLIVGGEKRGEIDYDSYVGRCRPGQQILITGRLTDSEVGALFRRSDIFVFPTLADTFPLVVLEAMAHGLPVIASRVGGIPHQVDARSGVLVTPGHAAELRSTVGTLARQRDRLHAMGLHARARVAADFTWERAAAQAVAGYQRVLRKWRPALSRPGGADVVGTAASADFSNAN